MIDLGWVAFLAPWRFLALLLVAAVVVAYVLQQRRRTRYAARLASTSMLSSVLPDRPSARRHLPPILLVIGLVALVAGFARPAREVDVPRERATVVMAIDVSLSMDANDVDPTRLQAAQVAAHRFIDELPPTINVGIVSFAETATVRVPPSTDRAVAHAAIDQLELAPATAVGEAIFASLDALALAPPDETGEPPPAAIVVLSDGETTAGRSESEAVDAALGAGVAVSTISFGTAGGVIVYDDPETEFVENLVVEVPVAEENLQAIAADTGGTYFTAASTEELDAVYADIGSAVGTETEFRDVADWFAGVGLLLASIATMLGLWWGQRLP